MNTDSGVTAGIRRGARLGLVLPALLLLVATSAAAADGLRAHEVSYRLTFKGIGGGDLTLTLRPDPSPDNWVYETRAHPTFLARFFVNPDSRERSWFAVTPAGVAPQRYFLDDGSSARDGDSELSFDWSRGRVTGVARGKPLDLPIDPGTQDVMSIRVAPQVDLLAGREPHAYAMLDGSEVKHYLYTRAGTARLKTALGELDTVIYTSERAAAGGKGRTWQYWYAPALGYLTVRAEQHEDGQTRMTLAIRSLKWLAAAPATAPATR